MTKGKCVQAGIYFYIKSHRKKHVWINSVDARICCPSLSTPDDPWKGTPPWYT